MTDQFPIKKILLAGLVIVVAWAIFVGTRPVATGRSAELLNPSANRSDSLVSSIQPISQANANNRDANAKGVVNGQFTRNRSTLSPMLDERRNADLKRRFEQANLALSNAPEAAATELQSIIKDYPSVVEPYLNLASIHAQNNDLQAARTVLLQGIEANQKADMLFDGLKKVHGAIAANAYRKALDINAEGAIAQATLPRVNTVVTRFDQDREIEVLRAQLDNKAKSESSFNETQNKRIAALEEKLAAQQSAADATKTNFEKEIAALIGKLAEQSETLLASQTAEREALARVVRAEQEASSKVAEISAELKKQSDLALAAQTRAQDQSDALALARKQTQVLAQRETSSAQQVLALSQQLAQRNTQFEQQAKSLQQQALNVEPQLDPQPLAVAQTQPEQVQHTQAAHEQQAITRIRSWASAWSAQDVAAYVSHYSDTYSSGRSITREQWLEQRQVRLTNKKFINVTVSEFSIKDLGKQFSVTFTQHYQSNTVDDTVRKRLIFNKQGDDWSSAKIVNERLVAKTS